jgi:two-component system response regulator NreC
MKSENKLRVFLVEDHHLMRQGLASLLNTRQDVQVAGEAANGLEALASVEAARPDVIIVDLSMPVMNGVEFTRRVRERLPDVPVLILSMYSDPVGVARALRAGAAGYIVKESMIEELSLAIHSVVEGGRFLSPQVAGPIIQEYLQHAETEVQDDYNQLSPRECEVLQMLAEGRSAPEIARLLVISLPTVRTHQVNLKRKLGLKNRAEIVRYALDHGILPQSSRVAPALNRPDIEESH